MSDFHTQPYLHTETTNFSPRNQLSTFEEDPSDNEVCEYTEDNTSSNSDPEISRQESANPKDVWRWYKQGGAKLLKDNSKRQWYYCTERKKRDCPAKLQEDMMISSWRVLRIRSGES